MSDPKDLLRTLHKSLWPAGTPGAPEFPHASHAIAADKPPKDKTVATKKKPAPKKNPAKRAPKREPTPEPDDDMIEIVRVSGHYVSKGYPSQSIKLQGKDELIMVHCSECKCSHYYLALPVKGSEEFRIVELFEGDELGSAERTPSGDVDTETAMEIIEDDVEEH